jgi:hypothetical protein
MIPTRVQRSRKAGSRQPEGTRYCGRGTKYGNDSVVEKDGDAWVVDKYDAAIWFDNREYANEEAVERFQSLQMFWTLRADPAYYDDLLNYKHLSCFCPLDMPCHVDPIIEHLKRREKELRTE